mmetsp:Transcript_8454/g.16618  ORF Transcript_8454/g.16618 Transcript_8454/m.16618 type:complete len:97 (+) Transcript_8454:219-509(+)
MMTVTLFATLLCCSGLLVHEFPSHLVGPKTLASLAIGLLGAVYATKSSHMNATSRPNGTGTSSSPPAHLFIATTGPSESEEERVFSAIDMSSMLPT